MPGLQAQIYVFWADKITGDPVDSMSLSGFAELAEISREVTNETWLASGQIEIPLGDSNSQPDQGSTNQRRETDGWGMWLG